jgi:preprotein translocase SecF subunit
MKGILKLIDFVPHGTKIDFFGHRYYAFLTSLIILGGSVIAMSIHGLNFGIDFTGGTLIEIETPADPDIAEIREELNGLGLGEVMIQEFGSPRSLLIRLKQQDTPEAQKAALENIRAALDDEFTEGEIDYRRTEFVGPQVGEELKIAGIWAVCIAMLAIMAYIWFRFNWQYGIGAMLALLHDVVGILGLFAVTQMHFDVSTLAAILLVAGYSINETVIIYDRVRETLRKFRKMPMPDVINYSINSTLPRTIMTSGSTLLAILALWLFGGEVIRSFVSALFLGILIGTHSSYFVSSNALYYLKLRPDPEKDIPE